MDIKRVRVLRVHITVYITVVAVVQSLSRVWLLRPRGLQHARLPCPSLSPGACSNSCPLSQWCHPAILSAVASFSSCLCFFPSIRIFSNELALHIRQPKYWSFSFSISPSNEYSGLISLKIDWFDLLVVQRILKSRLQHHSSKASILQALSLLYDPTLTSVHDYEKNHSFDCVDLCWQSNVSAF